ncbi:MAG: hypothetical protein PHF19_01230 [Synergistales bacterium]|jgi:lipopolysaccharide export system protein LptA|nr:hypothetical protein [Synergistales bacterium]
MKERASQGFLIGLLLGITLAAGMARADEASLRADELRYDPAFQQIRARGNVSLERRGMTFDAEEAEAFLAEGRFRLWGNVGGRWEERQIEVNASSLTYAEEGGVEVAAEGDVRFRRGDEELLCSRLVWRESGFLHITGGFSAFFEARALEAEEALVEGDSFKILGLKRFEDAQSGLTFRAGRIEGRLEAGRVVEATAIDNVEAEFVGSDGRLMRLSGGRALYSEARGTLVLSGSALARQADRSLRADSLVLHLASRRIEALGAPKITFSLPEKEAP